MASSRLAVRLTHCILCVLLCSLASPSRSATGRAVSLNALASSLRAGGSAQARSLCGITRVLGYLEDPSTKDVIFVGEVAPSLPALHADDLAVALRNAWRVYAKTSGRVRYYAAPGCSIDPDPRVLRQLQQVQAERSISEDPDSLKQFTDEWTAVGRQPQKVRVMGVPFDSRFARVMVDADYYMKRLVNGSVELGIDGFESVSGMSARTAKEAIASGKWDSVPKQSMNRFWFSPGESTYDVVDGVTMLRNCTVRLLTEEEFLTSHNQVAGTGRSSPHAAAFARGFTARYDAIAAARPIYRELEGLFRFAAIARLMKDAGEKCAGLDYLLKSHKVAVVPVSRAVNGLTSVREVSHTSETDRGTVTARMWFTSCGGVSMDVRPKRVSQPAKPMSPQVGATPASRAPAKTKAIPQKTGSGLRKTILTARKSPKSLSWDFPIPAGR